MVAGWSSPEDRIAEWSAVLAGVDGWVLSQGHTVLLDIVKSSKLLENIAACCWRSSDRRDVVMMAWVCG